jgi:cation diffusion facilitator family transporter
MIARRRAATVTLAAAALVVVLKLAAYALTGSVALLSDAAESVVNVVAGVSVWWAVRVSGTPPDLEHPYGHQRAENVSGAFEAALILVAAVAIFASAVARILDPEPLVRVGAGVAVAVCAAGVNVGVSRYLFRRARRLGSAALDANARHLRTDVVTTAGVVAGVLLTAATGWSVLDPLLAIAVAGHVALEGIRVLRRSLSQLLDERLPPQEEDVIVAALERHEDVEGFHRLRSRSSGTARFAEVDVFVDPELTVAEAHDLVSALEDEIHGKLPNLVTTIHVEPFEAGRREGNVRPDEEFPAS